LPRSIEGRGERPDGTGLLASLESSSPWRDPDDFRLPQPPRPGSCGPGRLDHRRRV